MLVTTASRKYTVTARPGALALAYELWMGLKP
jgi:hypothetical protein